MNLISAFTSEYMGGIASLCHCGCSTVYNTFSLRCVIKSACTQHVHYNCEPDQSTAELNPNPSSELTLTVLSNHPPTSFMAHIHDHMVKIRHTKGLRRVGPNSPQIIRTLWISHASPVQYLQPDKTLQPSWVMS